MKKYHIYILTPVNELRRCKQPACKFIFKQTTHPGIQSYKTGTTQSCQDMVVPGQGYNCDSSHRD